jgi:prophage tail gpP-like protein
MILKINDRIKIRKVDFFNTFNLNLRYDSIASTFAFSFYFDPNNPDHRELSCVSHFHEAIVEHNGETLVTGYILSEVFNSSSVKELVQFGGYSLPGVLEDCEIPYSSYPLESINLSLRQIAQKLLGPFKLKMVIDPAIASLMDVIYDKTTAKESDTIKGYLTELASQRNIIISHTEKGEILFTRAKVNRTPILNFEPGNNSIPFTNMSMSFSGQGLHSEITVVKQANSEGGNEGRYTVQNPYVPIVYRPKVIIQNSGDDNSTADAARNALAAELKNITLKITTDRWEANGKLIRPNNLITVVNPELFLFKKTNWFIESVDFTGDQQKTTAVITCVLPEVYNGQVPKNIFVDPHQNFPRI